MPLVVLHPGGRAVTTALVVNHLRSSWPGSLIILLAPEVAPELREHSAIDWVRLASEASWPDARRISSAWLASITQRFGCDAVLGVGIEAEAYMGGVQPQNRCLLLQDGEVSTSDFRGQSIASGSEQLDDLDRWLLSRMPIEVVAEKNSRTAEILAGLRRHKAWGRARCVRLACRGVVGRGLLSLLQRLCSETESAVEVRLLTSELFDLPRAGLTHTPAEFLLRPNAWRQAFDLGRVVMGAPGRVTIRIWTQSRAAWIRRAVELTDRGLALVRKPLRALSWRLR